MKSQKKLLILPGDGVGPEVCNEARKVIDSLSNLSFELDIDIDLIGGASIDKLKTPLSSKVLDKARNADSILLGAVGGKKWDSLTPSERPEKGGGTINIVHVLCAGVAGRRRRLHTKHGLCPPLGFQRTFMSSIARGLNFM